MAAKHALTAISVKAHAAQANIVVLTDPVMNTKPAPKENIAMFWAIATNVQITPCAKMG